MERILVLVSFFGLSANANVDALDLDRFHKVSDVIYRGDQPDTAEDYRRLANLGIKTIINLRDDKTVAEELDHARAFNMDVVNFPLSVFKMPSENSVNGALESMLDPSLQPVYIHCEFGKDRTGLVVGLHRVLHENWNSKVAYKEMLQFGFSKLLVHFKAYFKMRTKKSAFQLGFQFVQVDSGVLQLPIE